MGHPHVTALARQLDRVGETITLRRVVPNASPIEATVRARVTGYQPNELLGGINQGDRRIILSAEDVERFAFPSPVKPGDKVLVRGRTLNVQDVDDSTRRIAGELVAYVITVRG